MRTVAALLLLLLAATACDEPSSRPIVVPTRPSPPPAPAPPPPAQPTLVGHYSATFTASPSCASELPHYARERTYTATFLSNGHIEWSGPTVTAPPGHQPVSGATLAEDVLSFYIDVERDPQSDDFHGISDYFGNGVFLNISGKGTGTVHDREIAGTMNGLFAFWEPVPDPSVLVTGRFCSAPDHRVRFVKQ